MALTGTPFSVPAALSYGVGAQVQRPLAIVVVGGNLLSPILILIVLPVLIDLLSRRADAGAAAETDEKAGKVTTAP
ncbi:MAG: efflux RND transporter permease subunit [Roseiarcus sp.]